LWFWFRRHRGDKDTPHISTHFSKRRSAKNLPVDLIHHDEPPGPLEAGHNYEPEPYVLPGGTVVPPSEHSHTERDSGHYPPGHPGAGWNTDTQSLTTDPNRLASTSGRTGSKFTEAFRTPPPNTPTRFVLHTDAGEVPEAADENEVVELPPQYASIGGRVVRSPTYREPGTGTLGSTGSTPPAPGDRQSADSHEEGHPLLPLSRP